MMNPFKALGDINQMRKQAAEIQKALAGMMFTGRDGNVEVVMNGNQEVIDFRIDNVSNEPAKRALTNVIKQSQQAAAGKLADISKSLGMGE
jgi:DNA-binding protein YbaB